MAERKPAGGVTPPARPNLFRILDKLFGVLTATACGVGTLMIIAIMLLINTDVFSRYLFSSPVRGVPELISISIVAIVFLQVPHALRRNRFISSDVFIDRIKAASPRTAMIISAVQKLIGAALLSIIFWFSIRRFNEAWEIGEYVGTEGDFTAPIWPVLLVIMAGCCAGALQYLIHSIEDISQALGAASDD